MTQSQILQGGGNNHLSPLAVLEKHSQQLQSHQKQHQQQKQQDPHPKNPSRKRKKNKKKEEEDWSRWLVHHNNTKSSFSSTKPTLTAYLEPSNFEEWEIRPLPPRQKAEKEHLQQLEYPLVNSCSRLMEQFPVDINPPTDLDPFLPWIHDVFPTLDGKFIQFVAQNKRRCRTGKNELVAMANMQPQAALFQHVPIQRLKNHNNTTRYRLTTHKKSDPDGVATRFICRFKPSMEETLSVFNFDYDWIAFRKQYRATFHKDDGGIKSIHTSQLIFQCPVPEHLQESIRTGNSVVNDWATLFVDLIPIRTPPRYGPSIQFLQPRYQEFETKDESLRFDADREWGDEHILPEIEDSGRWENIPICLPSFMQYQQPIERQDLAVSTVVPKKHRLASCIWASAGYVTRGSRFAIKDGQRRLLEWLTYNKLIGFDHFYLYDNSEAEANNHEASLKPIADLFPDLVTYIPWPARVCNNRPNNVHSPGERSSQYAAEASCLLRFGPHVQWFGQFDIDEYLVPMGDRQNITTLLDDLEKEDTRIIAFGSWRAWPRRAFVNKIEDISDSGVCWSPEPCFWLSIPGNVTMLQAYNCDRQPPGKKTTVMPAEKQLYRADYVKLHFVHYSAVTELSVKNKTEWEQEKIRWRSFGFPDYRQRFGNEEREALMLHTKAVAVQDTAGYKRVCSVEYLEKPMEHHELCRLGVPWPKELWPTSLKHTQVLGTPEGYAYNCYVNDKIENFFVPRLDHELKKYEFLALN